MPRNKKSQLDSLERKVIETPSLSRLEAGIFNEGFDSLPHLASPSFFYINDDSSWMDNRRTANKRFTESWIELDRAYSCGSSTSYDKKCFSSSSTSSSSGCCCRSGCYRHSICCCSCSKFTRILVYLLIAISVIGFAAIVSGILYMEIFHKFDEPYFKWTNETMVLDTRANFNFTSTRFIPSMPQTTATTGAMSSTSVPFQDVSNKRLVEVPNTTSPSTTTSRGPSSVTISRNSSSETTIPFTVPSITTISLNDTDSIKSTVDEKSNTMTEPKNLSMVTTIGTTPMSTSVTNLESMSPTTTLSSKPTRDWSRRNPPSTASAITTTTIATLPTTVPPNWSQ